MRISAKADYAIRALVELAVDPARPLSCEAIASSQDIPFRFLKAVMTDLRHAGLVRSQRGCEGGYWLGRDPSAIPLADVINAVDGHLLTVNGVDPATLGYPAPADRVADLWEALRLRTEELLLGVAIADLLTDAPDNAAARLLTRTLATT